MSTEAIVLRFDDPDLKDAADVVFLHGRGGSERDTGLLIAALPGAAVRGYRGPLRQGRGFSWFLNSSIGVAEPESLAAELPKVAGWIDIDRGAKLPWLCGFSNGAAMAASLALQRPTSYSGLIMIGGCFAVENLPAGRLDNLPVLFCQGRHDDVIPAHKFAEARAYLEGTSGARSTIVDYDGGHDLASGLVPLISRWFHDQL